MLQTVGNGDHLKVSWHYTSIFTSFIDKFIFLEGGVS